ncbi:RabGAP/TBC [Lichtheimia hyalospora FSU 10163]|nr:RabGAP/TBC [Lichtheimia hyalospora FSU 10163]
MPETIANTETSGTTHKHSDLHDSDHTDDERFSICEYDLDVVDHALENPNHSEYLDHFGFRIQVKTDDEGDGSSDSDLSDGEDQVMHAQVAERAERMSASAGRIQNETKQQQQHSAVSSSATTTSSEDDDTDFSVDTTMTTPTIIHKMTNDVVDEKQPTTAFVTRRGRSATISKPITPPCVESSSPAMPAVATRRRRATTVSRPNESSLPTIPPLPQSIMQPQSTCEPVKEDDEKTPTVEQDGSPDLPPPPTPPKDTSPTTTESNNVATSSSSSSTTSDTNSIRSNNSFEQQGRTSTSARSLSSFNPFKRSESPSTSCTSPPSRPRTIERPSQSFRKRQSKRMSEFYRGGHSASMPSSPSTSFHASRLSYASATSYYDMLMSKFGRQSEDHPPPLPRESPKQMALREEARQYLIETLKPERPESEDWDFWESFLSDVEMVRSEPEAVKQHMIMGVPSELRGYLWQILCKSRNHTTDIDSEYKELLKRISPHEKSIRRDLSRTFPSHEFFQDDNGQEVLFHVIKAYSLFDPQVGYCQGLPFIVGCLLLHMSEDTAFCVLVKLMSQYGLRNQFMPQMELLHERLYQFDHLLQQKLPQVHRHLETQGVRPSMYASQWFLTLFSSKCPLDLVYRVFDLVFVEGTHFILRFALALMFRNQHTLMGLEFEALVEFLNNGIYDTYKDDERGFVQDAYKMDVSARLLARLAKQHSAEAAREAKTQSQEEHLRQVNQELSSHVRRLEKSYATLEKENQDVTQQVIDAKMSVARLDGENQQLRMDLSHTRTELDQLKAMLPDIQETQRQKQHLAQRNEHLENQLQDMEAILISLKVKYAESESAYEELRQKMSKSSSHLPPGTAM